MKIQLLTRKYEVYSPNYDPEGPGWERNEYTETLGAFKDIKEAESAKYWLEKKYERLSKNSYEQTIDIEIDEIEVF